MSDPNDPPIRRLDDEPASRVRVHTWEWSGEADQRRGIPWLGLFLVVFGGLLLVEQLFPGFEFAGAAFFLIVGLVMLGRWAINRRHVGWLYGGAIVTALAAPGVLEGLGIISGPGLGTLCLGIAFLAIAAVRAANGAGIGWQTWVGVVLVVLGASQLVQPRVGDLILPILIVILGALIVIRGLERSDRR